MAFTSLINKVLFIALCLMFTSSLSINALSIPSHENTLEFIPHNIIGVPSSSPYSFRATKSEQDEMTKNQIRVALAIGFFAGLGVVVVAGSMVIYVTETKNSGYSRDEDFPLSPVQALFHRPRSSQDEVDQFYLERDGVGRGHWHQDINMRSLQHAVDFDLIDRKFHCNEDQYVVLPCHTPPQYASLPSSPTTNENYFAKFHEI